jgi:hypothetical protein
VYSREILLPQELCLQDLGRILAVRSEETSLSKTAWDMMDGGLGFEAICCLWGDANVE